MAFPSRKGTTSIAPSAHLRPSSFAVSLSHIFVNQVIYNGNSYRSLAQCAHAQAKKEQLLDNVEHCYNGIDQISDKGNMEIAAEHRNDVINDADCIRNKICHSNQDRKKHHHSDCLNGALFKPLILLKQENIPSQKHRHHIPAEQAHKINRRPQQAYRNPKFCFLHVRFPLVIFSFPAFFAESRTTLAPQSGNAACQSENTDWRQAFPLWKPLSSALKHRPVPPCG